MAAFLRDDRPALGVERNLDQRTDLVGVGDGFHDKPRGNAVRTVENGFGELAAECHQGRRHANE